MLIINADDWGGWQSATDAALACYKAARITSVSAMVFMEDSERGAKLALEHGIGVGLHINFSQAFSGKGRVAPTVAHAHARIMRFLRLSHYALLVYNPFLVKSFRLVFEAQVNEFIRLYGKPPSHYDGHQHFHLCMNMLLSHIIPEGAKVRRSFSFFQGDKGALNRYYRRWVDRGLAAHHFLTDYFFSLSQQLEWGRLARVIELSQSTMVELMAHPEWGHEYEFLMGKGGEALRPHLGARAVLTV